MWAIQNLCPMFQSGQRGVKETNFITRVRFSVWKEPVWISAPTLSQFYDLGLKLHHSWALFSPLWLGMIILTSSGGCVEGGTWCLRKLRTELDNWPEPCAATQCVEQDQGRHAWIWPQGDMRPNFFSGHMLSQPGLLPSGGGLQGGDWRNPHLQEATFLSSPSTH